MLLAFSMQVIRGNNRLCMRTSSHVRSDQARRGQGIGICIACKFLTAPSTTRSG